MLKQTERKVIDPPTHPPPLMAKSHLSMSLSSPKLLSQTHQRSRINLYNFSILYNKRLIFLFYTNTFEKHQHHIIYSTNLFNKIFILLQILIISFNLLSLSLSLSLSLPSILIFSLSFYIQRLNSQPNHNLLPTIQGTYTNARATKITTQQLMNNPKNSKKKKIHNNHRPRKSKHPKFYRKLHTHKPRKSYQPRKFIPINLPIPTTMK